MNCALALSQQASAAPIVQREVGRLLVSLAQHGTPASAVTGFQRVLGAGLPVPEDSVRDCVRELARRDDQCCAVLRQTAAVAGFGCATSICFVIAQSKGVQLDGHYCPQCTTLAASTAD